MQSQAAGGQASVTSLLDRVVMIQQAVEDDRNAQRLRIRHYLQMHGPTTDFVITKDTGISPRAVLVRLHELESVGDVVCDREAWPGDPTRYRHLWRLDR
jgi:predicted ArsR family transcriptional regulator